MLEWRERERERDEGKRVGESPGGFTRNIVQLLLNTSYHMRKGTSQIFTTGYTVSEDQNPEDLSSLPVDLQSLTRTHSPTIFPIVLYLNHNYTRVPNSCRKPEWQYPEHWLVLFFIFYFKVKSFWDLGPHVQMMCGRRSPIFATWKSCHQWTYCILLALLICRADISSHQSGASRQPVKIKTCCFFLNLQCGNISTHLSVVE